MTETGTARRHAGRFSRVGFRQPDRRKQDQELHGVLWFRFHLVAQLINQFKAGFLYNATILRLQRGSALHEATYSGVELSRRQRPDVGSAIQPAGQHLLSHLQFLRFDDLAKGQPHIPVWRVVVPRAGSLLESRLPDSNNYQPGLGSGRSRHSMRSPTPAPIPRCLMPAAPTSLKLSNSMPCSQEESLCHRRIDLTTSRQTPTTRPDRPASTHSTKLSTAVGMFAEDSWKVTQTLTLNFGLRWDLTGAQHDLTGAYHSASTAQHLRTVGGRQPLPSRVHSRAT